MIYGMRSHSLQHALESGTEAMIVQVELLIGSIIRDFSASSSLFCEEGFGADNIDTISIKSIDQSKLVTPKFHACANFAHIYEEQSRPHE